MITELGKFLRELRFDKGELLMEMAKRINIPSSTLSSIETGKRKPNTDFAERIIRNYSLEDDQIQRLLCAVSAARDWNVGIDASSFSAKDKNTAVAFARHFSDLDDEGKDAIWKILDKRKD